MALKKLLIPTDLSENASEALKFGAVLSTKLSLEITLLYFIDPSTFASKTEFQKSLAKLVEEDMQGQLGEAQKINPQLRKVKFQTIAETESKSDMIVNFSQEQQMGLIIIGQTYFSDPYDKSMAFKIISHADCPVISWGRPNNSFRLKNILLPLDLTESTLQKVLLARELAAAFESKITLFSVFENEEEKNKLLKQQAVVANFLSGNKIETIEALDKSHDIVNNLLIYQKEHKPDLTLIMKRPSFLLRDFFVGPKALRVLRESGLPVLTVRPAVESQPEL